MTTTSHEQVPQEPAVPPPIVPPNIPGPEETSIYIGPEQPDLGRLAFEEEQPDLLSTPLIAPFQLSNAMPGLVAQGPSTNQAAALPAEPVSVKQTGPKFRVSLTMIAILACLVVIIVTLLLNALTQAAPALPSHTNGMIPTTSSPGRTQPKPTVKAQTGGMPTGTMTQGMGSLFSDWVPQTLPNGWTNAGLSMGDELEALRTATAFTDREMSLDYRSVGTRTQHAGTFTAAIFLLTPAARQRFAQNDVRVIDNALFDRVVGMQIIRMVIDAHPQVVQFTVQGQQQLAWVDVAFQLWQSSLDPNNPPHRLEGKDLDPATQQPRVHHLVVLLLRVTPAMQGGNPAMGGTGWLVSNYALDQAGGGLPAIVQPA